MRRIRYLLGCKCKTRAGRFCINCALVFLSLPLEHAAWEWTPGATRLLSLVGLHV